MNNNPSLAVREMQQEDIEPLMQYWLEATPNFLTDMGVDLSKMPTKEELCNMLTEQLAAPYQQKQSYATIWLKDNQPIGHCNVNDIVFGKEACMHLHLWRKDLRKQGIGSTLIIHSIRYFFEQLELKKLVSEPYALNTAPHKTLEKIGFHFEKEYTTIPGSLSFEQKVRRYVLTGEKYLAIKFMDFMKEQRQQQSQ